MNFSDEVTERRSNVRVKEERVKRGGSIVNSKVETLVLVFLSTVKYVA